MAHKKTCPGCAHLIELHDDDGCEFGLCPCSMAPKEIALIRVSRRVIAEHTT